MEREVDMWKRELLEAGWTEVRWDMWRAPNGGLYRGPFGAWKIMRQDTTRADTSRKGEG